MKQLPAKTGAIQPTEIWSPSMGGKPMPLGEEGTYGAVERNVRWLHSRPFNRYWERGQMRTYPRNPVGCYHYRKKYSESRWICSDCGDWV